MHTLLAWLLVCALSMTLHKMSWNLLIHHPHPYWFLHNCIAKLCFKAVDTTAQGNNKFNNYSMHANSEVISFTKETCPLWQCFEISQQRAFRHLCFFPKLAPKAHFLTKPPLKNSNGRLHSNACNHSCSLLQVGWVVCITPVSCTGKHITSSGINIHQAKQISGLFCQDRPTECTSSGSKFGYLLHSMRAAIWKLNSFPWYPQPCWLNGNFEESWHCPSKVGCCFLVTLTVPGLEK